MRPIQSDKYRSCRCYSCKGRTTGSKTATRWRIRERIVAEYQRHLQDVEDDLELLAIYDDFVDDEPSEGANTDQE